MDNRSLDFSAPESSAADYILVLDQEPSQDSRLLSMLLDVWRSPLVV
ncbi:MAG: hypothetical protein F6K29_32500, partial [Okeania sp. SIO2G5]|nr:hypothetical protein [Okeania sp. SIO2G5]